MRGTEFYSGGESAHDAGSRAGKVARRRCTMIACLAGLVVCAVSRAQVDHGDCRILNTPDPLTGRFDSAVLWPGGVVPFEFVLDPDSPHYVTAENRLKALAAMDTIEAVCDADFVPRNGEADYVLIRNDTSSYSWVGMKGGEQTLGVWPWDAHYVIVHELVHALGAWHEQQRPDRGTYVTINWDNIPDDQEYNFFLRGDTTVGRYDFDSVMHYRRFHWTGSGLPTIEPRPGYERWKYRLGRVERLSAGDILLLTGMYGGPRPPGGFDLLSPPDGTPVGTDWSPLFEWGGAELADSYRLLVDDDRAFASPYIDVTLSDTLHLGGALENGRVFYWTVIASNADGTTHPSFAPVAVFYTGSTVPPTLYVDDDAPAGGNGLTWASAFDDLQAALDLASCAVGTPVVIRMGQGVYTPDRGSGDRSASFVLRSNGTVRGGYAGYGASDPDSRDPHAYTTILSGDLAGDDGPDFENNGENSMHVLWAAGQRSGPATLDGVAVTAGNADGAFLPTGLGGGLWADDCELVLRDCVITRCDSSFNGGGAYLQASDVTLDGCTFINNRAVAAPLGAVGLGAGLMADNGPAFIFLERCTLAGNQSRRAAGAFLRWCTAELDRCEVRDNAAGVHAGGITIVDADVAIRACRFVGNAAASGLGGALLPIRGALVTLVNCELAGNTAGMAGGAVHAETGASVSLINCTVADNAAPTGSALYATNEFGGITSASLRNSVVYANSGDPLVQVDGATIDAAYCDIQGGWAGDSIIDADPRFFDGAAGDYRLLAYSPCIDAGDNTAVPDGVLTDLDGNPRFHDDPWSNGLGAVVDIGAYEFQGSSCAADANADGSVDTRDVLAFLNAWNGQDPASDCDGNGTIDTRDVLCFLNLWTAGC